MPLPGMESKAGLIMPPFNAFDHNVDDVEIWVDRLEQYFLVQDIPEKKKVPIFLTLLSSHTYTLLRDLCTPEKPASFNLPQLLTKLSNHVKPKISEMTERYKFRERGQLQSETVSEFVASLKRLSLNCKFSDLDVQLRDQLVCGVRDINIKKKLLSEQSLTFTTAFEIASSMEMTAREAKSMLWKNEAMDAIDMNYLRPRKEGYAKVTDHNRVYAASSQAQRRGGKDMNKRSYHRQDQESYNPKYQPKTSHQVSRKCYVCGDSSHLANSCKFKAYVCRGCGRKGHLIKVCKSKVTKVNMLSAREYSEVNSKCGNFNSNNNDCETGSDSDNYLFNINDNPDKFVNPYKVTVCINDHKLCFEVDCGSNVSVVSEKLYSKKFSNYKLLPAHKKFYSYDGSIIEGLGYFVPLVRLNERKRFLKLYVVKKGGPPLLGRSWMKEFGISIQLNKIEIENESEKNRLSQQLRNKYHDVFSDKLGLYNKAVLKLELKEGSKPIFIKPYSLAYALKPKVEQELDRLLKLGILKEVKHSEYGTPIVPIVKKDGSVRITGNYKLTINKQIEVDRYPIPKIEDLLSTLGNAKLFTKLDLSSAYNQIPLHKESKPLLNISTPKGIYEYQRLVYGVSSGPGFFQREMEKILQGLEGVIVFLDDILISGTDIKQLYNRTDVVLNRLRDCGLTLSKSKCSFFNDKVKFLGYSLDENGLKMDSDKVKAITSMPSPTNVSQLQAFLGMIAYYRRFLKNASIVLKPLYNLLQKSTKWNWSKECESAFSKIKQMLCEEPVLMQYNPQLPIKLTCDASQNGIGAVISHILPNNDCKPIAFASKTLSKPQQRYSQIDKEAYSIIFGVSKFQQYLYGNKFILETDHAPLVTIFGPKRGIPTLSTSRLQRWALYLSGFNFEIKYCKSSENIADGLSRLPCLIKDDEIEDTHFTYLNMIYEDVPILEPKLVLKETSEDKLLRKIITFVRSGWPKKINEENLKPFWNRRNELSIENDCLMWGYRLVIPSKLQQMLLKELHIGHQGIVRTKALARSYVWWPNIDQQIERLISKCNSCIKHKFNPPTSVLSPWKLPSGPTNRIHADFLGPINNKHYLIIIDAFSKWIEVKPMYKLTSFATIEIFRNYFATWGLPNCLVTDNGTSFCSIEFANYLKKNGVRHIKTSVYCPYSNGAAENAVKTFKIGLKKILNDTNNASEAIALFLFNYRITPHSTTKVTPAELQIGRKLRNRFDLLKPNLLDTVIQKQEQQIKNYHGKKNREFEIGQQIMYREYGKNDIKWCSGIVKKKLGSVTYLIKKSNGDIIQRHINQLWPNREPYQEDEMYENPLLDCRNTVCTQPDELGDTKPIETIGNQELNKEVSEVEETTSLGENSNSLEEHIPVEIESLPKTPNTPIIRRSTRIKKKVVKLNL